MKSFFAFWDQVDPKDAFPQFGALHIAALAMMALVLYLSLKGIKRMKPSKAKAVIRVAAVAVPVVEFTHTYWLYLCGEKDLIRLLPLHLCAMQSFFIPLAVFSGKTIFREFIYATSILGGIFATVFPVGVADVYPLLHYQTIQTFVLHSLLIFVPMALIMSGEYRPDPANFPRVVGVFLAVAAVAAAVDFTTGQNYMFINYAPQGTPLETVYYLLGRGGYLIVAFLLMASISFCMYLPYLQKKKQEAAQHLAG